MVLDLGSGGGIDVLLSAKRVGPTGKAYGLDMTDDMLALANENKRKAGATNVEFLKGEIEHIPLSDNTVDVIISNCVINLSADKDQSGARGVPGLEAGWPICCIGRRDARGDRARNQTSVLAWIGCVAGALDEHVHRDKLAKAGFMAIDVEPTRIYRMEDAKDFLAASGLDAVTLGPKVDGQFMSAFVRARKPSGSS